MLAVTVAMAAQFLSGHYGVPVMLMAILLGMPLHFLAEDDRAGPGIDFAARALLRRGWRCWACGCRWTWWPRSAGPSWRWSRGRSRR
nr:hypothetical protein [Paracoccus sp. PAMC 22219]